MDESVIRQAAMLRSIAMMMVLFPQVTYALPGARPGEDCSSILDRERSEGSKIEYRAEKDAYFVVNHDIVPERIVLYDCDQGRVSSQMMVLIFDSESRARQEFVSIRDDLEREIGPAEFDGTNSRDQRELSERLEELGAATDVGIFADWVKWEEWQLSLYPKSGSDGRWVVGLSFREPAA